MSNIQVIAEIGCSHVGSLDRAKLLIKLAKESGADVAKFQKRNPYLSVRRDLWDKPHPNEMFAYGSTYLEHRLKLELSIQKHKILKDYCESINIIYSSSVWDIDSAKEIVSLNPKIIKIPSPCNNNYDMIDYIFENYNGQIHISLGMTTNLERKSLINKYWFNIEKERRNNIVFYHCVSGYPVPFNEIHLNEITKLYNELESCSPNNIGFSNHGFGIALEPAALALGARWFERHFIDDRTFRHTDASCSLEPQGLLKLTRDLKAVEQALTFKSDHIESIEVEQRKKLRG
jgi:N-acetylneuraminate synthase